MTDFCGLPGQSEYVFVPPVSVNSDYESSQMSASLLTHFNSLSLCGAHAQSLWRELDLQHVVFTGDNCESSLCEAAGFKQIPPTPPFLYRVSRVKNNIFHTHLSQTVIKMHKHMHT